MIQRIQTVHLLLSVVFGAVALVLGLNAAPDCVVRSVFAGQAEWGRWAYLALIGIGVVLAAWSIFLFKTRMKQLRLVKLSTAAYSLTYVLVGICWLIGKESEGYTYGLVFLLPVICIIFNLLAARRIRYDERLVRSADRLR